MLLLLFAHFFGAGMNGSHAGIVGRRHLFALFEELERECQAEDLCQQGKEHDPSPAGGDFLSRDAFPECVMAFFSLGHVGEDGRIVLVPAFFCQFPVEQRAGDFLALEAKDIVQ